MRLPSDMRTGDEVKAEDFNTLKDALKSLMIQPGVGYRVSVSKSGTLLSIDPGDHAAVTSCPLGAYSQDPDTSGNVIIVPGWIHAPNKSELIEPQSITQAADTAVWIKLPWTATLNDDDVLEAGGEVGTIVVQTGASVPDNEVPHVDDLTGILYVPIGAWDGDEKWISEGCGTITVGFCPRVFSITRANE